MIMKDRTKEIFKQLDELNGKRDKLNDAYEAGEIEHGTGEFTHQSHKIACEQVLLYHELTEIHLDYIEALQDIAESEGWIIE
jgi:hypothetical protein